MKTILNALLLALGIFISAQVGINTTNPTSTLTVNGSFGTAFNEITSSSYTMTNLDSYVVYNGTTSATITLPAAVSGTGSFTGRIYKIKNVSPQTLTVTTSGTDKIRPLNSTPVSSFNIPTGAYIEVVNNNNTPGSSTWDLAFIAAPNLTNVEIYGTQLKIPPHANATSGAVADWSGHNNTGYDTTNSATDYWYVISKTSTQSAFGTNAQWASKMQITYEYQGPAFNLTNMYAVVNAGNNTSTSAVFTPSFISLSNVGGKTQLVVTVSRVDLIATGASSSDWGNTYLVNVLLARRL